MLLQSEEVGERLAWMFKVAERIDDWNIGVRGHLFHGGVAEGAQHDQIDPALEVVVDVAERFAGVEAAGGLVDKKSGTAQAVHAGFESEAGAEGGLFEKHHHLLAGKSTAEVGGTLLKHRGQVEEGVNLVRSKVVG